MVLGIRTRDKPDFRSGLSGWWFWGYYLIYPQVFNLIFNYGISETLLAIMGVLWLVWLLSMLYSTLRKSDEGKNKYGPDPRTTPRV